MPSVTYAILSALHAGPCAPHALSRMHTLMYVPGTTSPATNTLDVLHALCRMLLQSCYIRPLESHVHRYQVLPLESVCHRPCPGSINGVPRAMILICSAVVKQPLGQILNSPYRYLCDLGKVTSLPNASVSPTVK